MSIANIDPVGISRRVRVPRGTWQLVLRNMAIGSWVYVRPQFIIGFRKAAREMGIYIVTRTIRRCGRMLWRAMRVSDDHPSGHIGQRMPGRDERGLFLPSMIKAPR